ncbi:MAG TPA: tetratricopeptide repeat protein [Blastocatellia bacterium]|nr:tetratricopeptide repeat protein [Blastocatellia bacterium]
MSHVEGRGHDALALLKAAIELHPGDARFHAALGDVYSRQGLKEQAVAACRKALELDPDFAPARELIKKLLPWADEI